MLFKKTKKKYYLISSLILILVVTGYTFYRIKKKNFLDHQLQNLVKEKTNRLYTISYDSIAVDEVGGDVYIKNIHITGDTSRQLEMISRKDTNAVALLFDIYIPILKVIDFKTARALLSKQLICKQIIISEPKVHVYLFPGQAKPKDPVKSKEEVYKQLLGDFKLIQADSISVLNGEVVTSDFFTREVKFTTLNTTVSLSQVAIDSTYNQDTTRTLFCKQIAINAEKIVLGEKKNTAEITRATFDTQNKILFISSFDYDAFKNNGFFKSKAEGILVEGIEWSGPVENSKLVIEKAVVNKGEIVSLLNNSQVNDNKIQKEQKILTGWIKSFSLNKLQVKSLNIISKATEENKKPIVIKNNAFLVNHLSIDRSSKLNGSLIGQAKEIEFNNDEITIKSADNRYLYKVTQIKINSKSKSIKIRSISIIPQLNETLFAKKAHFQMDRYDIQFQNINCINVNIPKLLKGDAEIEKITTSGNKIKIFHDLSYPIDSISKLGQQLTYPHQIIRQLGFPVKIQGFNSTNTYIEYKEKNPQTNNSGRVRFANTNITINNISNHTPRAHEKTTVRFTSDFLEKIPVTGGFTFFLDQWQKGTFTAQAAIPGGFDAGILNQLLQPMSLAKVEKGTIHSVSFYMKGDTNSSNGTLSMPYNDLKISLLNKRGNQYSKKGIISLLANIILKNKNKEGADMRTGISVLKRNKYRSFFNFVWKTIFNGIKDICVLKI